MFEDWPVRSSERQQAYITAAPVIIERLGAYLNNRTYHPQSLVRDRRRQSHYTSSFNRPEGETRPSRTSY